MKNLTDKLTTQEQLQFAQEVADKAKLMGVDPRLAVALAFRESKFDPAAIGADGEIGLMQVLPSTAKGMGFSAEDLRDPSKNIEIGLTYLKQNLEKFEGNSAMAAAAYNAGPNHPFFSDADKPLPASTEKYLADIRDLGGFEPTPAQEENSGGGAGGPPPGGASENDFKMRMLMDAAGITGGAIAGKVSDVGRGVIGGARDLVRASRTLPGALSVMESMTSGGGQAPSMPSAPSAPTPQAGALRPVAGGPAGPVSGPVGGPAGPLTQMGGSGTYNYGKAFGLTDIEAGLATDMSKQPGGASDLIAKRTEALQKIQNMGGGFVENPNYGGIMTPDRGVGSGPRASFTQQSAIPPNPDMPSGRQPGLAQLPPTAPISAAPPVPPQPGALSQAGAALKQGAGAVLRSPLAQGAMGGLSIAESAMEADRQIQAKDTTGAGIAAAGVGGGAMQIFGGPKVKAIGALISAASPLTLYLRENLRKQAPMPDPTEAEMLEAQMPAFNMYPRPTSGPVLRSRMP
jgi:hypothetical protein